jgi:DNA-binding response OmpR family regulator
MKKTILVMEGSDLVRNFLIKKLGEHGFEVLEAKSGFEGLIKLKNSHPDLVVMEYLLPRVSGLEFLEEKQKTKPVADIPVILFSSKVSREKILAVAKYKVARFFSKPLRVDTLMKGISEVLGVDIVLDATPCNIDVHLNEEILFIELAQGLNPEKIEIMEYKIAEILALYGVKTPRILIIMTGVELKGMDALKLSFFFRTVLDATGAPPQAMRILTTSPFVKEFIAGDEKLSGIGIATDLSEAMDGLLGIKVSDFIQEGYRIVRDDILAAKGELAESIHLGFEGDKGFSVAVVDDDVVTRELVTAALGRTGWEVLPYENGRLFVDDLPSRKPDLVFLDLIMPVLDGFGVLSFLKASKERVPVIIFSNLSDRQTVVKALSYGVKSYLTKPLAPTDILSKAVEILKPNF